MRRNGESMGGEVSEEKRDRESEGRGKEKRRRKERGKKRGKQRMERKVRRKKMEGTEGVRYRGMGEGVIHYAGGLKQLSTSY